MIILFMRMACPLAMLAALALAMWAWRINRPAFAAVNLMLVAVNGGLTFLEWRVLS